MKLIFIIGVFVILIFGGMYFGLAGAEGRVEVVVKTLPSGGIEGKSVGILDVEKKEVPVYEVKKVTQKELKEIREKPLVHKIVLVIGVVTQLNLTSLYRKRMNCVAMVMVHLLLHSQINREGLKLSLV